MITEKDIRWWHPRTKELIYEATLERYIKTLHQSPIISNRQLSNPGDNTEKYYAKLNRR